MFSLADDIVNMAFGDSLAELPLFDFVILSTTFIGTRLDKSDANMLSIFEFLIAHRWPIERLSVALTAT